MKQTGGYILTHDYWEQLTAGASNLHSLQCWASQIGMHVVEPFVMRSSLGAPNSISKLTSLLRFSDIYDMEHWNTMSLKNGYIPLASWEEFTERAPRNVIRIDLKHKNPSRKNLGQLDEKGMIHGCPTTISWNKNSKFLEKLNFSVVKDVCINFGFDKIIHSSQFYYKIFGSKNPSDSTLKINQWRGIQWRGIQGSRVQINDSTCKKRVVELQPSKRLFQDAKKYIARYLKTSDYLSIMTRMEKTKSKNIAIRSCFYQTLEFWNKLVKETGINVTFLSSDIGRFGSNSFKRKEKENGLEDVFSEFFNTIYGNKLTVNNWETSFEETSGLSNTGYISMLQKVIASQAKCILLVGGGSFQRNALHLYQKKHSASDWCIHVVNDCTDVKSLYKQ